MQSIITSYLVQSKECDLPGIGSLQLIESSAATASEPNRILPPSTDIVFKRNGKRSDGLVTYIATVNKISEKDADDLLSNFCKEWKQKIENGDSLHLETIGSIKKNSTGDIVFEKEESIAFYEPIEVDHLYNQVYKPTDQTEVQNTPEESVFIEEVVIERSYWGLWSLILFAIAAVMIFYHFQQHGVNSSSIGNQKKFVIDSAHGTYKSGR